MFVKSGHPSVQRQRFKARTSVVIGNESVKEPGAAGGLQGINDGAAVERGDETAGEGINKSGASLCISCLVVMSQCYVRLSDNLIGRKHLVSLVFDEGAETGDAAVIVPLRFPYYQSDKDGRINPVTLGQGHVHSPYHP